MAYQYLGPIFSGFGSDSYKSPVCEEAAITVYGYGVAAYVSQGRSFERWIIEFQTAVCFIFSLSSTWEIYIVRGQLSGILTSHISNCSCHWLQVLSSFENQAINILRVQSCPLCRTPIQNRTGVIPL